MTINFTTQQKILFCLIGSGGSIKSINEPISGSIKLMKEAFLLKIELKDKFPYNFLPYDFGPCSFELYEDLNLLIKEGLINEESNNTFSVYSVSNSYEEFLTKMIDSLESNIKNAIIKIKKEFNKLSYYALIYLVYQKYPQFTKASKFRL